MLWVCLQEPPKQQLLQYESGALRQLPRLSLCILQTPPEFVVYEAVVDLQQLGSAGAAAAVIRWTKVGEPFVSSAVQRHPLPHTAHWQHAHRHKPRTHATTAAGLGSTHIALIAGSLATSLFLQLTIPTLAPVLQVEGLDGQPLATPDDCLEAEAIARDDARVQAMMAQRGVAFDKVACDPWAIHACPPEWQGRRLMQVRNCLAVVAGGSSWFVQRYHGVLHAEALHATSTACCIMLHAMVLHAVNTVASAQSIPG